MAEDSESPKKPSILKQRGGVWTVIGLLLVGGIVAIWALQTFGTGDAGEKAAPRYEPPRNLVVISIDTLRADHLGCYGHDKDTTPNIDAIAKEGVLFERYHSSYPLTLPAHLTQLSGVSSLGHRVRDNLYHRLPDGIQMLPELMKAQGFNTGAFVSAHTMRAGSGIERGFDVYNDDDVRTLEPGRLTIRERKAPETLGLAADWISGQGGDRFFCFIHLFDPHAPYEPHADLGEEFHGDNRARYDGEIAFTDREIGRFLLRLQQIGVDEDTLLVITSDHGEGLGDHGEVTHGYYCYDTTTHVPLVIRGAPGFDKGTRVPGLARDYDLAPTLVELMGLEPLEFGKQFHGLSLTPAMRDPSTDLGLSVFVESHYAWLNANWAKIRGLRTDDALTLFSGDEVLHFTGNDQDTNRLDENSTAAAEARSEIERLMNAWVPPREGVAAVRESVAGSPYPGESPVAQSFDPESLNDTRDLPSPHARVEVLRRYQEAELEYDAERFALCAQMLRELLEDHDDFAMAHKLLAAVNQGVVRGEWQRLGKDECERLTREAVASLHRSAELAAQHNQPLAVESVHRNLALLLMWLKDPSGIQELDSGDPSVAWMEVLARYRATGSVGDAGAQFETLPGDADFKQTAERHLELMRQGEPLNLAPWEQ